MSRIAILLLGAGASSRMRGGDKLLEPVDGTPLIVRQTKRALEASRDVLVALPAPDHPRAALLQGLPVTRIAVPDASNGMSASIRRGVAALPAGLDAVMILPADMPDLTAADLRAMVQAYQPGTILRATAADGTHGHPVIFPTACFDALQALDGDQGARPVLAQYRDIVRTLALPGHNALTDLDTPEDWAAWRDARTART